MLARSHYCALAQARRRYCNVLISGEAIRKACPLHSTQGSPDFVGVFQRIGIVNPSVLKIFCGAFRAVRPQTAVFLYETHSHLPTEAPK